MTVTGIQAFTISAALALAANAAFAADTRHGAEQTTSPSQTSRQGEDRHGGHGDHRGWSDRALEDRVYLRLIEYPTLGPDITVDADDGVVSLTGTVGSEAARQRALRVARRTRGVVGVKDRLRVDPALAQRVTAPAARDEDLTERVARQIARELAGAKAGEDWWGTGWRVEGPDNRWSFVVEAHDGAIILEGDVPRHEIIRKAAEAARRAAGVRSVRSELEVKRSPGSFPPYGAFPYGYPDLYPPRPHPYGHMRN